MDFQIQTDTLATKLDADSTSGNIFFGDGSETSVEAQKTSAASRAVQEGGGGFILHK